MSKTFSFPCLLIAAALVPIQASAGPRKDCSNSDLKLVDYSKEAVRRISN